MLKMRRRNKSGFTRTTSLARMVIELVMVVLIPSNPVVSTSQPCGSLRCENGGKCMDLSVTATSSSSSLSNLQASGKLLLHCLCPPGYGGVTCSYYHGQLCSEKGDSTCSNGSSNCIPNPLNSNVTECPCDVAYAISPFAGQMCESPETEYCLPVWSHEPSRQFFCTNGGRCFGGVGSSTTIQEESDTWGMVMSDTPITCQCPPEFEGPHCEILIGVQAPLSSTPQNINNMSSTASWLRPFLLSFFLTLTVITSIGLFVQWKYIGIHVTPNHGEQQQPDEADSTTMKNNTKEYPPSDVQNGFNKGNQSRGMDFDEMIEIEEDTEGEFV